MLCPPILRAGFSKTKAPDGQARSLSCDRRDSNPHEFPHRILNPARIPIPPRSLVADSRRSQSSRMRSTTVAGRRNLTSKCLESQVLRGKRGSHGIRRNIRRCGIFRYVWAPMSVFPVPSRVKGGAHLVEYGRRVWSASRGSESSQYGVVGIEGKCRATERTTSRLSVDERTSPIPTPRRDF